MSRRWLFALLLLTGFQPGWSQTGEINLLTDLGTPFPPGCLSIALPEQPASDDNLLVDAIISAPTLNSPSRDGAISVRIWRVACDDDDFSVVLVRLRQVGDDDPIVVPQLYADAGSVDVPFHQAQLLEVPGAGNVGASGGIVTTAGQTWMLAVNPISIDGETTFLPADYNDAFTLEINWESYATAQPEGVTFLLDEFRPSLDPPQFDQPLLNGRFSGQWVLDGAPRQGLVLQIAERESPELGSVNFVFAIFFTYLNGEPVWVVGNSEQQPAVPGPVEIAMATLENGAFISNPNQPPRDDVIPSDAGDISIEVIDCNRIRVNYDFQPLGHGTGSIELERFLRIAGYDCNPWE